MKIRAHKSILVTALSRIQGVVEKNSIKPITSNALIKAVHDKIIVSATNLQIAITATYENITVEEEGEISVNARRIFEIIRELPDLDLSIEEKENYHIKISSGRDVNFNIIGLPPEDFPSFIREDKEGYISWDNNIFLNMLALTSFSISHDETKQNICGAYIENIENELIRMVATDGYRLAIADEKLGGSINKEEGLIIPSKAIQELNKLLLEKKEEKQIRLLIDNNTLVINVAEIEFFIRLIEKKFPNYNIIVPGDGYKKISIKLRKEVLRPALKRMSIISHENNRPVVFSFNDQLLSLHTEDSDLGSVKEDIILEEPVGDNFSFCINGMYMLDIINVVEEDIIIEYNIEEEKKPIIVKKCKKDNLKYIIMPMLID